MLGHILASEEIFPIEPNKRRRLPLVESQMDFDSQLASIGDNLRERAREIAPDHSPVMATFGL